MSAKYQVKKTTRNSLQSYQYTQNCLSISFHMFLVCYALALDLFFDFFNFFNPSICDLRIIMYSDWKRFTSLPCTTVLIFFFRTLARTKHMNSVGSGLSFLPLWLSGFGSGLSLPSYRFMVTVTEPFALKRVKNRVSSVKNWKGNREQIVKRIPQVTHFTTLHWMLSCIWFVHRHLFLNHSLDSPLKDTIFNFFFNNGHRVHRIP